MAENFLPPEALAELERMRTCLGRAIEIWAELENGLADFLSYLIDANKRELGLVIYYSPSNMETRIAILDAVFIQVVPSLSLGDHILKCWIKFLRLVGKAKTTRNKMIHGNIRAYGGLDSRPVKARLVPPTLDPTRWKQEVMPNHQYPGMSIHDVTAAGNNFQALRDTLYLMVAAIREVRKEPYDWHTWLDKVRTLEANLRIEGGLPPAGPIPPEH
jgi:hypothetical protein